MCPSVLLKLSCSCMQGQVRTRRGWRGSIGEWGGHDEEFVRDTIDEVRRVAALNGLKIRKIYPVGGQLWLKKFWPGLFCHEISCVFEKA